jgi:hypothetical protein
LASSLEVCSSLFFVFVQYVGSELSFLGVLFTTTEHHDLDMLELWGHALFHQGVALILATTLTKTQLEDNEVIQELQNL